MITKVSNNLISGVLSIAQGGLGSSSTPSNGQIPIGNGSVYVSAAITGTANRVTVTNGSGTITLSGPQDLATSSSVQFGSFGVGTAASGTTGEIRATNDITGFYSSDKRLKENIKNIENPLQKLSAINGVTFDWTEEFINSKGGEDGFFVRKNDIGVIAQEIEQVLPQVVAERPDGVKAVNYEKLVALLIEGVKELQKEVDLLKKKLES